MHHYLSRGLYRRLAQLLEPEYGRRDPQRARQILLHACETTMMRLADDRQYITAPDRFLFGAICMLYPSDTHARVRTIINQDLGVATAGPGRQEIAV